MNDDALHVGPACAVALLAATLALMTAHSEPESAPRVEAGTLLRLMGCEVTDAT